MSDKERQYLLVAIALLFALLAFYYFMYINPMQNERHQKVVQIAQLRSQSESLTNQNAQKPGFPPQELVRKLAELIPVKPYTDQLIIDLGRLRSLGQVQIQSVSFAAENDVNLKDLAAKIAAPASKNGINDPQAKNRQNIVNAVPAITIKSVEMTLSITGDYKSIYKFITETQNYSRYLRVDSLSFASPATDGAEEKPMTASIKLTSYYAPQFASLLDKAPAVSVEPPSGKWNPLHYPVIKKDQSK